MQKFVLIFLIFILIISAKNTTGLSADSLSKERVFFIEEKIILKDIPKDTKDIRIWFPCPVSDNYQTIDNFQISPSLYSDIIIDKEYGNKIIYLKLRGPQAKNPLEIILSFHVKRKEQDSLLNSSLSPKERQRFLKADRLVPVNGKIKKLAEEITQGKNNDLERVRAIYDYLIDTLTYSKDDPNVCGIGNSLLTLQYLKGICTDYHSLFISLVRSLGIPAKFEIGFKIPENETQDKLNGYHCWAKFFLKDKGWVPVDISEADKHPEKRDYFFGHLDENRIHFTTGRDIGLKYAEDKDVLPLNFLIYPYIELDGKQVKVVDFKITFKELRGGDRYGKLLRSKEGKAGEI